MNSIPQNMTRDDVIACVVAMIRAHGQDKKIVVVVEGDFDVGNYEKFYPSEKFDVFSCGVHPGCKYFSDLCEELKEFCERFCVIKDADFDRLNGVSYGFPNLFLTDTHDLETMMFTKDFYNAVASKYKVSDAETLVYESICGILHLSYIKWMNSFLEMGLIFDEIKVGQCYKGVRTVDIKKWVDYIKDCNNGHIGSLDEKAVKKFEDERPLEKDALLQLTNGHDLVAALERRLNSRKRQNIGINNVEKLLSDSFTTDDYRKTNLYNDIKNWLKSLGFVEEVS